MSATASVFHFSHVVWCLTGFKGKGHTGRSRG